MSGSLDPAMTAETVRWLPQVHFVGANDRVVPPIVVYSFFARLSPAPAARIVVLPGFDHECCWAAAWPRLLELSGLRP